MKAHEQQGEVLPQNGAFITIDTDGVESVEAFEVQCFWPDTVVSPGKRLVTSSVSMTS